MQPASITYQPPVLFAPDANQAIRGTWEHPARDYQREVVAQVAANVRAARNRNLVYCATGLGKTRIATMLPEALPDLAQHGVLFLAHLRELVYQAARRFEAVYPGRSVHMKMGGHKAGFEPFALVASVQSLGDGRGTYLKKIQERIGLVITDEAHHCTVGGQYARIFDALGVGPAGPRAAWFGQRASIGLSATPNRADGAGLHPFFDDILPTRRPFGEDTDKRGLDLLWGIRNGWLVDIVATRVNAGADLSSVRTRAGDLAVSQLSAAVDTHHRNDVAVKAFLEHGEPPCIVFCVDIKHAEHMAEQFRALGVEAYAAHSGNEEYPVEPGHTKRLLERFRKGAFPVLVNVAQLTEGVDVPGVRTVIMARPTKSTPFYVQALGRGTRPAHPPQGATATQRKREIQSSEKPHLRLIELTDNAGRHDLVSIASLFGLDKAFNPDGLPFAEVLEKIEELEDLHPEKPIRLARSLEEVKIVATQISVWEAAEMPENLKRISPHTWTRPAHGVLELHLPHDRENGVRPVIMRAEKDGLGMVSVKMIVPAWWDGKRRRPGYEKTSDKEYRTEEEAVRGIDAYAKQVRSEPRDRQLMEHNRAWMQRPVSDGQASYLKRLGVWVPTDTKGRALDKDGKLLTRGQASRLINVAKAKRGIK